MAAAERDLFPLLAAARLLTPQGIATRLREGGALGGGRGPVTRLALGGTGRGAASGPARLVLRPLRRGGWLSPWLGCSLLGPQRPFRELACNAELRRRGAPVARPAFAAAWRRAGPLWNAVYATWEEERAENGQIFLAAAPPRTALRCALRAVGTALRRFHDAGGIHPDLNLRNVLLRRRGTHFDVIVIDLDGARVAREVTPQERMRGLMRLYRSALKVGLLPRVGLTGCAQLFGAYCGTDRQLRRALRNRLARERFFLALRAFRYRHAVRRYPLPNQPHANHDA